MGSVIGKRDVLLLGCVTLASGLVARTPLYAQDYPSRPITVIVPAAAGSPSDFPARLASQILPSRLGQPVVVEYRPGAAGAIGARAVAAAPPDGYTLLIGNTSTLAAIPAVSASAGYDPIKDFTPIVKITEGFQILVVDPSSSWKTIKDLVEQGKANPGAINYAHTGSGGFPNLAAELFMLRTGIRMTGVSFRGGGLSVAAILGHVVDLTFENTAILVPLIHDGKLRALAAQNDTRTPLLPDLPTMAEAGVPDCEAKTYFGLVAPAGTPAAIVNRINAAMNEGMQTADMQRLVANVGSEAKPNSPSAFADFIAAQYRKWSQVSKAANVKID
jgi:tripartite-type tricarboxylate transporter receptor subunit TctC